jgi:hypothetical protein
VRTPRCYLIYALAPRQTTASEANDLLNEYVEDRRRGIAVFHDHFTGLPHGGFVVLDAREKDELVLLDYPGPLVGWEIAVHPLTFALAATGFLAQARFTLEQYRGVTFAELVAQEPDDPRFWWRRASR